MTNPRTVISIVVPCLNEEPFIHQTLRRLTSQKGAGDTFDYEILVVDGLSTDQTQRIVTAEAEIDGRIRLLQNKKRITPAAFNLGIENARGRYICILGAHAEIANDYLLRCLETAAKIDADNVGGPWIAKGQNYTGEAIALAFRSPFAVGSAPGHNADYEGYVDTVWGGFYKREVFERIGVFDEALVRNQDDELNLRLTRSGGKIWQSPSIKYNYYCRGSLSQLWKQYLQYGYWKVRVIQKHRLPASIRHLIPGGFVATSALGLCLIPFGRIPLALFALMYAAYLALVLIGTVLACASRKHLRFLPLMPLIFATFHFAYGTGFLCGVWDFVIRKSSGRKELKTITRSPAKK